MMKMCLDFKQKCYLDICHTFNSTFYRNDINEKLNIL